MQATDSQQYMRRKLSGHSGELFDTPSQLIHPNTFYIHYCRDTSQSQVKLQVPLTQHVPVCLTKYYLHTIIHPPGSEMGDSSLQPPKEALRMSFRPSGCGGRSDAEPPHVEKRRRLSRPSSFIMGPAGAPSVCGRERWGIVKDTQGQKVEGGRETVRSVPRSQRAKQIKQPNTHTEQLRH